MQTTTRLRRVLALAILALLLGAASPERPTRRWAVLIAGDGTADQPGTRVLSEQVREIGGILSSRYGYPPESIVELYDDQAVARRIFLVLSDLRDRVEPGDSVIVFIALPETGRLLHWVPWDGSPEASWSLISPAEVIDTLGQLDRATILQITPTCLAEARSSFTDELKLKTRSLKMDSRTVLYSLSGCSRGLPQERFASALAQALATGLGSDRLEFTSDDLASYLRDTAPGFRVEYLRQFSSSGALLFVRERQALDAGLLADLAPSRSPRVRLAAVQKLLEFVFQQPAEARSALIEELADRLLALGEDGDEDPQVRNTALAAVGRLRFEPAMPRLAQIARTAEGSPAVEAVRAIEEMGGERAIGVLEELLGTSRPEVRATSIHALAHLRSTGSLPAIVERMLGDFDRDSNLASLEAIQVLSPDKAAAVDPVVALLERQPGDPTVRREAIGALGNLGQPAALPVLLEYLTDPDADPALASAAAYAIAKIGASEDQRREVERALILALRHDPSNTVAVALALGRHGSADAVKPLCEAARATEPGSREREAVAGALGALGDRRATPFLLEMLRQPSRRDRRAASQALGALGDPSALTELEEIGKKDEDPYVRAAAAEAVNKIRVGRLEAPTAKVVDQLVIDLGDPEHEIRQTARRELNSLPEDLVLPALEKALRSDRAEQRRAAAYHLDQLAGSDRALSVLLRYQDDPEASVREAVAWSLGAFRDPRALAALRVAAGVEPATSPRLNIAYSLEKHSEYLLESNDLAASREVAELSLDIREGSLPGNHPFIGRSLGVLARIDTAEGDLEAAERKLRRAIETTEPSGLEAAAYWRDYGRVLELRGDLEQATSLYFRVLEVRQRELAPDSHLVEEALVDLARVLELTGHADEAEKFRRRAAEKGALP